jgi:hypothetical protein
MKQWYETLFENYGRKYDRNHLLMAPLENVISSRQEIGF